MGKGDKRSRRGKIFAGSFGKTRPKRKTSVVIPEQKAAAPAAAKAEKKPRTAVKVKKTEPPTPEAAETAAAPAEAAVEAPAEETHSGDSAQPASEQDAA